MQDNGAPRESRYEHINLDSERAEEDAAEKLVAASPKVDCEMVLGRAIWRKVTPSSKKFADVRERAEKAVPPVPQVFGRVLAAGINMGCIIRENSSKVYSRMSIDTKKGQDEMAFEYSTSSSGSSLSCAAPYPDDENLLQVIRTIEKDNYWAVVDTPNIEDDWDELPEAGHISHVHGDARTFNSEMRHYYEKERAKIEAEREGNIA